MGLARSLRGEPSSAWRRLCDLYRLLAQTCPRGEGPKKYRSLRGYEDRVNPKLLLPMRGSAAIRTQALAAHGQYPAGRGQIDTARALQGGRLETEQFKFIGRAVNQAMQSSLPGQQLPSFTQETEIVDSMALEIEVHAAANSVSKRW
jgi:hypothetical protein